MVSLLAPSLAGVTPEEIATEYELSLDRIAPLHAALGVSLPSKRAAIEAHGSTAQATPSTPSTGSMRGGSSVRTASVATTSWPCVPGCSDNGRPRPFRGW